MNILVKLPSRGRPKQFRDVVVAMNQAHESRGYNIHWLFTLDKDDPTRDEAEGLTQAVPCGSSSYPPGNSTSKIHAVNRDINECEFPWDILVVASDDMWPVAQGWDTIIRNDMAKHFPDLDGMLWYPDGYQKRIITMPILGAKYYRRFGFVYHPSYKSTHCDNEQTEVAQAHGKVVFIDRQLFDHRHPGNGVRVPKDETYRKCDKDWKDDETNCKQRRLAGFPL